MAAMRPPMDLGGGLGDDEGPADVASEKGNADPQFAADISQVFPDLDDEGIAALQSAIMGLLEK